MPELSQVESLSSKHSTDQFDCGRHESLNLWLKRYALQNQASGTSRTYVVHRANRVVGYYAISAGSIVREDASPRVAKGQPNQPIPICLLGRLAVDKREQGQGLGKALLKDALLRINAAADILGIRAILVHAIDRQAAEFYRNFDFEPCPGDDLHLVLLMKDLRKQLR